MSVPAPNCISIPNIILDLLPALSGEELKLIMAVCREHFGWNRRKGALDLAFIRKSTGLSQIEAVDGLKSLAMRDWVSETSPGFYQLVVSKQEQDARQGTRRDRAV